MEHSSNSGREGGKNPSNEIQSNLSSPANQSLKQSLYIAALDRFLDLRGFVWPVTDRIRDTTFTFDFYHPEDRKLVKVFRELGSTEVVRYKSYLQHRDVVFVFDSDDEDPDLWECEDCGGPHLSLPATLEPGATALGAYVYHHDRLWEPGEPADPHKPTTWIPIVPVEWSDGFNTALEDDADDSDEDLSA